MNGTAHFTVNDLPARVTAIQTGTITIKRCHYKCCVPLGTPMALRFAAILADRRWAEPLPIWTFVIEHPEGIFVVDAGATPAFNDDASWKRDPATGKLLRSFLRIEVEEDETLPAQMQGLGIPADDVSAVVLTHQHIDHTAAVPAFDKADIWTTNAEDRAKIEVGSCQWRWRSRRTKVRHIDKEGSPSTGTEGVLGAAVDLVADGSLRAIHTPGHTPGSASVVLTTDTAELWFTGDTSFTAETMSPSADTAGVHTDMSAVRRLHEYFSSRQQMVFPSHDWANLERLAALG